LLLFLFFIFFFFRCYCKKKKQNGAKEIHLKGKRLYFPPFVFLIVGGGELEKKPKKK
jgi:hypothetical protein